MSVFFIYGLYYAIGMYFNLYNSTAISVPSFLCMVYYSLFLGREKSQYCEAAD